MKQSPKDSPQRTSLEHNLLIQYLDQFGKQMSTRKNNCGLEQQLSSLSRAYNQAQEKLLQTEKTLMSESILIQKQRSIIELYKYILGQEMEDEGILTFIQHLEEQQSNGREIYEELAQLKNLLNKKKLKHCKKSISGSKNMRELKNEVERLQEDQKSLNQESICVYNENQQLRVRVAELAEELARSKNELEMVQKELTLSKQQLEKSEQMARAQKQQNLQSTAAVKELSSRHSKLSSFRVEAEKLVQVLQSRLSVVPQTERNKENAQNSEQFQQLSKQYIREIDEKLVSLSKYKQQYKKLKEHYRECELHKREISLLKLFVSEQALTLFKEYEQHTLECLQGEIRNLAVLQKNKLLRLQECERQIWKYRLQLMKDQQAIANNLLAHSASYNANRMVFSKDVSTNNVNMLSIVHPLSKSVLPSSNVSEFTTNA